MTSILRELLNAPRRREMQRRLDQQLDELQTRPRAGGGDPGAEALYDRLADLDAQAGTFDRDTLRRALPPDARQQRDISLAVGDVTENAQKGFAPSSCGAAPRPHLG